MPAATPVPSSTRRSVRVVALATVLGLVAILGAGSGADAGPAAERASQPGQAKPRAALAFRAVKTLARTLSGNYNGAGPAWEHFSSPAIGDVTGDATPEVVWATVDGQVSAVRTTDFSTVWTRSLGATSIQASPVLAQVRGSGAPDVIVATMDGRIVILDGPTGAVVLTVRQGAPQFCPAGVDCRPDGFFGTPAVADIDGDGAAEIVASSYDHSLYAWEVTGGLIFRRFLEDTLWSSPVVGDVDGDGRPEIVVGGDIYGGSRLGVPAGGLVWVLKRSSGVWNTYPGYPRSIPGQTVWSTPALGDVNGDGKIDIVVGTGNNFTSTINTRRVYAFSATTRRDLPGWPVGTRGQVSNSVAVGDIEGDGATDVAFGSEGSWTYLRSHTGASRWVACATGSCANPAVGGAHGGVTMADLDGDGVQEVVSAQAQDLVAFDGKTGARKASIRFNTGTEVPPSGSPAIADLGGKTLVAVQAIGKTAAGPPGKGAVERLFLFTTDQPLCRADWPQFKRTVARPGEVRRGSAPWYPLPCARSFVLQQYRDILGRDPDTTGLYFWVDRLLNRGVSGAALINSLISSSEFQRDLAPIVRVYLGVTGLPPTSSGAFYGHVTQRRAGTSLAAIADEVSSVVSNKTDLEYVRDAFRNLYGRVADHVEQSKGEAALLVESRGTWLVRISDLPESVANLKDRVLVTLIYSGMLDRVPDLGGFTFWVGQVKAKGAATVISSFQNSNEYVQRVT